MDYSDIGFGMKLASESVVWEPTTWESPGSLWEMQNLNPPQT